MGKKAKTKRALERKKQKRARKEEERRKYANWRDAGANTKSKRFLSRSKNERRTRLRVRDHRAQNIGDATIFPAINLPHLVRMYFMKRAGMLNQYTGKHTKIVHAFIEKYKLFWMKGEIYSEMDWTNLQPLSNNNLRKLAAAI